MMELSDHNQPVDAITLTDALRTKSVLEQIGGPAYIAELADAVPTAANVAHYARIVHEKAVLRSLATIATDIALSAYEANANVDELPRYSRASHLRNFRAPHQAVIPHDAGADARILTILERLYENRELVTGVPTGFKDLDTLTAGLQPSDLVVIAARPSMGKTALALNIAAYAAMDAEPPTRRRIFFARNVEGAARAAHAVLGGAGR